MQAPALVKPVATQGWNATPDVQSGGGWGAAASNDPCEYSWQIISDIQGQILISY